jgi:hypothetical protein
MCVNLRAMLLRGAAGRVCHPENVKLCMSYLQQCRKIIKMLNLIKIEAYTQPNNV